MNDEKTNKIMLSEELDDVLPKYEPIKLSGKNLAQNYVSAFNTGMNIYQCINQLQGYIEWVVKAVNDVVKLWNEQVGESIDQSKSIVRETTTEQFNTEWTNKQPELIEQVNTLTTNQFNNEKSIFNDELNTLNSRMDTFTNLPEGSTSGDAELQDIRVGANGVTYPNAGDAVRGQYRQLKEDLINNVKESQKAIEDLNDKKITKFYTNSLGETTLNDSDNGKIQDMILYGKSLQDGTPTPDNPIEIQSVVNPKLSICGNNFVNKSLFDKNYLYSQEYGGYEGEIQFQYFNFSKLYNIVLLEDGVIYKFIADVKNPSINGTDFITLRIKYEDGTTKTTEKIELKDVFVHLELVSNGKKISEIYVNYGTGGKIIFKEMPRLIRADEEQSTTLPYTLNAIPVSSNGNVTIDGQQYIADYVDIERGKVVRMVDSSKLDNTQSIIDKTEWVLAEPQENDLTAEQVQKLKELKTYYPTTNISCNSEQLDGYIVFNYQISLANGWNYVKQQLNDNRDYIYDMDLQSAEAYVNSEYAVTLTELEV